MNMLIIMVVWAGLSVWQCFYWYRMGKYQGRIEAYDRVSRLMASQDRKTWNALERKSNEQR